MTILVGLYCKDAVIIGTDSAATFSDANSSRTIEQGTKKIDIIGERVIIAGTGSVGLGQRFKQVVKKLSD